MKFGINFFPAFRPNQKTTAEYYSQCLGVSERADELGFSSIKAVEHYFHDYGGHSPNCAAFGNREPDKALRQGGSAAAQ
jgi:hypothetical protein